jgi:hypothetical protein
MTTPTELTDRLGHLLDELAQSTPIDDTDTEFEPQRLTAINFENAQRRPAVAALSVAAAAAVLLVGGLVVVANRSGQGGSASPIVTAPIDAAAPNSGPEDAVAPGAMTFDSLPAGFSLTSTNADVFADVDWDVKTRFYTADAESPDTAATFAVTTAPAGLAGWDVPTDATTVTVQGLEASIYDDPRTGGRSLSYLLVDQLYMITGYRVTDAEIITVAANTGPAGPGHDNYGAIVDPAGLPAGVDEAYIGGSWFERWFIGKNALTHPVPASHWDSETASLWIYSLQQNPRWLPLTRIGWTTITDITVHDQPAFIVTADTEPEFRGVNWIEGNITYLVGSRGLDDTQLLDLVQQLRPATTDEWTDMLTSSGADVEVVGADPTDAIPTPTTVSPVDSAVEPTTSEAN